MIDLMILIDLHRTYQTLSQHKPLTLNLED